MDIRTEIAVKFLEILLGTASLDDMEKNIDMAVRYTDTLLSRLEETEITDPYETSVQTNYDFVISDAVKRAARDAWDDAENWHSQPANNMEEFRANKIEAAIKIAHAVISAYRAEQAKDVSGLADAAVQVIQSRVMNYLNRIGILENLTDSSDFFNELNQTIRNVIVDIETELAGRSQ